MAHFAKIENDIVTQIIVVNNEVLKDENGQEQESIGIAFCKSLFGENTNWVQTFYDAAFRGKYAGLGDKWDKDKNEFVYPENNINNIQA
jgi:hypothetical protein